MTKYSIKYVMYLDKGIINENDIHDPDIKIISGKTEEDEKLQCISFVVDTFEVKEFDKDKTNSALKLEFKKRMQDAERKKQFRDKLPAVTNNYKIWAYLIDSNGKELVESSAD